MRSNPNPLSETTVRRAGYKMYSNQCYVSACVSCQLVSLKPSNESMTVLVWEFSCRYATWHIVASCTLCDLFFFLCFIIWYVPHPLLSSGASCCQEDVSSIVLSRLELFKSSVVAQSPIHAGRAEGTIKHAVLLSPLVRCHCQSPPLDYAVLI